MRRARAVLALIAGLFALPAQAEAPATSLIPPPRPAAISALASAEAQVSPTLAAAPVRPRPRPDGLINPAPRSQPGPEASLSAQPSSLRPRPRPDGLIPDLQPAAAVPAPETAPVRQKPPEREKTTRKGSVCGVPGIKGEKLAPITSKVKGCGVEAPVRVTAIDGIRLSQPATINCDTAIALRDWINQGMRPAFGKREVVELQIAASYICRPRNNVKGGKVSEHGRGRAIDVSGFVFGDGTVWSVLNDYNAQMRKAHKAACGIFGTTLGPGSDGYHENHLHFDTASYRSGAYCR